MSVNNSQAKPKFQYVYKPPPRYDPFAPVLSVEDFARKTLNLLAGGDTEAKHKEFLTNKLNEIGYIIHKRKHKMPVSGQEDMIVLMAESLAVNHMLNNNSTYVLYLDFIDKCFNF